MVYKVFIVDDDPAIVTGLLQIIKWEEYGMEVCGTALNGREAYQFIENQNVDILITDIKMPFMDGLELIRRVKETKGDTRFIILSGFDDFDYLKESIKLGIENYILKPVNVEELTETLVNTSNKIQNSRANRGSFKRDIDIIRSNILYRFITGAISEDELQERLFLLDISLNRTPFAVGILRVLENLNKEKHSKSYIHEVENICNDIIKKSRLGMVFCSPDADVVFLFYSSGQTPSHTVLRTALEECRSALKYLVNLQMFMTVGSFQNNWRLIERSYHDAKELQQYSLIMPPDSILDAEMIEGSDRVPKSQRFSFDEIKKLTASKNVEGLLSSIDVLFQSITELEGITPSLVQNTAVEVLFLVINTAQVDMDGKDGFLKELQYPVSDIYKMHNLHDIIQFTKYTAVRMIEHVVQRNQNMHPTVKRTIQYIKANFAKEISLKTLAYEFNVNANYLGRLFKEESGEFFSDYINKVRVEKAKELLSNTNQSVREVSECVGYTDANYFYRLFKKYSGVSPAEFKSK